MIVVKAGGGAGINMDGIARGIAALSRSDPVVLIHGANALRNDLAARLGIPVRTVVSPSGVSSVYTDAETLEVFLMAYAGLANKRIVARLQSVGVNAVGLCGVDGRLWEARAKKDLLVREGARTKLLRDNLTGRVESVNAPLLRMLLKCGYLPVLSAPAISREHDIVNADNDVAAAVTATELKADTLVFLFEAPGLLRDLEQPDSLVTFIPRREVDAFLPFAKGRMQKKLIGAKAALEGGVREIFFGDGRTENPLEDALAGRGTVIH